MADLADDEKNNLKGVEETATSIYAPIGLTASSDGADDLSLLPSEVCVSSSADYMISVLASDTVADGSEVLTTDTEEEQLVGGCYIDTGELNVDGSMEVQPAFVLNLPYSIEASLPVAEDDDLPERPVKRFRLATAEGSGYDVILAVAGQTEDDELVSHGLDINQQGVVVEDDGIECDNINDADNDDINQAWFTTRGDKIALQSKGHKWKQGQWTKEEIDQLAVNIELYCQNHGIQDPVEVIFHMSKEERKDFYRSIAKGIQRPLFSVYRRVIRMYDEKNYHGKYSPDELTQLRELRKQHGTDWAAIGAALGRSASSVKDRCRLMKDTCNTGKWFAEEERKLTEAVYLQSGAKPGESVTSGLSWAMVAEHVGTRSEKQCRTKWLNYLNWKQKGGAVWTREDDLLLLAKLGETDAAEEGAIDWQELADQWPSVRSPQWLRGKWWSMKRHVKDYQQMTFPTSASTLTTDSTVTSDASVGPLIIASSDMSSSGHLDLSQVLPANGIVLNLPLDFRSLKAETVGAVEDGESSSSSQSLFDCTSLIPQPQSRAVRPVVRLPAVRKSHSGVKSAIVATSASKIGNTLSRVVSSHTLFAENESKPQDEEHVEEGDLTIDESIDVRSTSPNAAVSQSDLRDFHSGFHSFEQESIIEIGGEMSVPGDEDEVVDIEGQTELILKSDHMANSIEMMPLDDVYTEVIGDEDLVIESSGDVITLDCSSRADGDGEPCFSDTILLPDGSDLLSNMSSD